MSSSPETAHPTKPIIPRRTRENSGTMSQLDFFEPILASLACTGPLRHRRVQDSAKKVSVLAIGPRSAESLAATGRASGD